jgi:hypothetical protein
MRLQCLPRVVAAVMSSGSVRADDDDEELPARELRSKNFTNSWSWL